MTRVAALLTTPKFHGGTETALFHTVSGLRELGVDVDVIALALSGTEKWRDQAKSYVNKVVFPRKDSVELALSGYDGMILSNVHFDDRYLPEMLANSNKISPWTSGWHGNSVMKSTREFHDQVSTGPKWKRNYVSFWPTAEEGFPELEWYRTILPYRLNPAFDDLLPVHEREYDFLFAGRVDPKKGAVAFISALEWISRRTMDEFTARIAGAPNDLPGGPHIHQLRLMLENWGWTVMAENTTMKSTWSAVHPCTKSVIDYTGPYEIQELPEILGSGKIFTNLTSGKASNSHLEYATMEAMDAGCIVMAKKDWPDYHYPKVEVDGFRQNPSPPQIFDIPEKSYRIVRGSRIIYNDVAASGVEDTYVDLAIEMHRNWLMCSGKDQANQNEEMWRQNRDALFAYHNPVNAAKTFLDALELS